MEERARPALWIDLARFKLHLQLKPKTDVTLHFDSPSRRFYLSVIALVLMEMKRLGQITSIPLEAHADQLRLLNETIGDSAGSSEKENLIPRIYRKWKGALPDLENAPLFKVVGRKKEEDGSGKTYQFSEAEKDAWANLFEYMGSKEHVRLRFSIDKVGATLDDALILYEDARDRDAWDRFIASLEQKPDERSQTAPPAPAPPEPSPVTPIAQQESVVKPRRHRNTVLIASLLVAVGIAGFVLWHTFVSNRAGTLASIEKMALPLPDKPPIAVLPFTNLSDDPKQEYLADGFAEAIIDGLSKCPQIFVIARNSSFSYKGKQVKIRKVAEDLGVRYVLEGSLQKTGNTMRITVQLIDALTGQHLFSERYDRELKDILAMQDEMTMKVLAAVQVKLTAGEDARLRAKGTTNLEAYLTLMQARQYFQAANKENLALARRLTEQAIALDPSYAAAYVMLGGIQRNEIVLGVPNNPREAAEQAFKNAEKAVTLDDSSAAAHVNLSKAYIFLKEHDKAIAEAQKAVSVDPNSALAYDALGMALSYAGRPQEAIPFLKNSFRLSPIPSGSVPFIILGHAYFELGQYEEAVATFKRVLQLFGADDLLAHLWLAATYASMGREKEAHAEAAEVLRLDPTFSVEPYCRRQPYKNQKVIDDNMSAMRKAGLK